MSRDDVCTWCLQPGHRASQCRRARWAWAPGIPPGVRHLAHMALAIVLLVAAGLLAGCGGSLQLQPVKVPVPLECREQIPDRPTMPTDVLTVGHSLDQKVAAALAEIEIRAGYEGRLLAALQACTRPIGPQEGGRRGQ